MYVHPSGISQPSPLAPPPIYRPSSLSTFTIPCQWMQTRVQRRRRPCPRLDPELKHQRTDRQRRAQSRWGRDVESSCSDMQAAAAGDVVPTLFAQTTHRLHNTHIRHEIAFWWCVSVIGSVFPFPSSSRWRELPLERRRRWWWKVLTEEEKRVDGKIYIKLCQVL